MVVLLIMSIILAAMAPVMTTRMRSENSQSTIWRWAGLDSIDAYFGVNNTQSAMLGQSTKAATDSGKLIINTPDTTTPAISFKLNGTETANVSLANTSIMFGKYADGTSLLGANSVAIGNNITLRQNNNNNSVVIGHGAKATRHNGVVIGKDASLGAVSDTGTPVNYGEHSVVIGYNARSGKDYGISIGSNAGSSKQGGGIVAIGAYSGQGNTTGIGNTSIGYYSLQMNQTGSYNTAVGYYSLQANQTGLGNTAVGYNALKVNNNHNNTAVGWNSLSLATGTENTGIGQGAMENLTTGSDNTAVGEASMVHITTGNSNTGVGQAVMKQNTTGDLNVAMGQLALRSNTTGSCNTAIGSASLAGWVTDTNWLTSTASNNNTALGYKACNFVTGSNKTCIGYNSGPAYNSAEATNNAKILYLGEEGTEVRIPGNLRVGGALFLESGPLFNADETIVTDGNGNMIMSDRRLKYVGTESTSGLDKIRQLKVFNYTYKKDDKKIPHVGVIAQDLQKVFPDAVKKGADGFLTIRKEDMFYALINAVKELDAKISVLIENQKQILKELNALRKENKELKKRLDKLERR